MAERVCLAVQVRGRDDFLRSRTRRDKELGELRPTAPFGAEAPYTTPPKRLALTDWRAKAVRSSDT